MTFDYAAFTLKFSFVKWVQTSLLRGDLVVLVWQDLYSVSENEEESVSLWKSFHLQSDLRSSSFPTE